MVYNTRIFYFSGGTYFDYLIGKNEKIEVDGVILQNSDQRKFNFGYSFTIGLEKNIDKTKNIFVEGRILQNLLDNNRETSGITLNGYSNFGIALGINHKFLN